MATIIHEYLPNDKDEYSGICCMCGFPLTKYHIAADFTGTCINYAEHQTMPFSFCVCADCLEKMVVYTNGGPDEAYRRVYVDVAMTYNATKEYNESTEE